MTFMEILVTDSPYLAFFLIWFCFLIVFCYVFKTLNRIIRGFNIRKHGWPPVHCDADGDFATNDSND